MYLTLNQRAVWFWVKERGMGVSTCVYLSFRLKVTTSIHLRGQQCQELALCSHTQTHLSCLEWLCMFSSWSISLERRAISFSRFFWVISTCWQSRAKVVAISLKEKQVCNWSLQKSATKTIQDKSHSVAVHSKTLQSKPPAARGLQSNTNQENHLFFKFKRQPWS